MKYLEYRLIQKAKEVGRYQVVNGNDATASSLPRADRATMEEFLENIEVLLGVLGHRVFVPPVVRVAGPTSVDRFRFTVRGAEAFGAPSDEGFIVFRGSTGLSRSNESMRGAIALKEELLAARKLVKDGALVRFQEDVLFATPSQAGSMVTGSSCNGRVSWKRVSDGRTLNEIESDEAG